LEPVALPFQHVWLHRSRTPGTSFLLATRPWPRRRWRLARRCGEGRL